MRDQPAPYKTAEELEITEQERDGLINLIPRLLAAPATFTMRNWKCCVLGQLERDIGATKRSPALSGLYLVNINDLKKHVAPGAYWSHVVDPFTATASAAAIAVTNFLQGVQ